MSEQKITFRTNTITAIQLKEEAENHNLTLSAFINFIINDYEKLKRKMGTEEKTGYLKNTLDKIFEMLEANNSLALNFQNTERVNLENQIKELSENVKDKTERYEKIKKSAAVILDDNKRFTELFFAVMKRYRFAYEDILNTYLSDEYCNSEKSKEERKLFMEGTIKPDFREPKKGFF